MIDYKCPVCGNEDCEKLSDTSVRCKLCMTTDVPRQFTNAKRPAIDPDKEEQARHVQEELGLCERQTRLSANEVMREYFPPDNVQRAAQVVADYFAERGAKTWAFGELQSRNWNDPTVVPNATLADARRIGMAFRCDVIPRAAMDKLEEVMRDMEERVRRSREHEDDQDADSVEIGLQGLREVLALMRY